MKTYDERTTSILEKAKTKRQKRKLARISACTLVIILGLTYFIPHDAILPNNGDVNSSKVHESDYYAVIEKLTAYSQKHSTNVGYGDMEAVDLEDGILSEDTNSAPGASSAGDSSPTYEEITDNQVLGVIEGDRIKRSSEYIYYLRNNVLTVYSIAGEASKAVGSYVIPNSDGFKISLYEDEWEIFLSSDCKVITLVSSAYHSDSHQKYVTLVNLDVSDPTHITEIQRSYLSGGYLSARMVDGDILLMSCYNANLSNIDFDDITTFIPQYGTLNNMQCIKADNILAPDSLSSTNYTVVCKIDGATLKAESTAAFLSYSDEVYVSEDRIYASRIFHNKTSENGYITSESMTEISALTYSGEQLEFAGSIQIAGYLENQYSMDEYKDVLRVVTTTTTSKYYDYSNEQADTDVLIDFSDTGTNASLYCIDLTSWEIVASVEKFAPYGETVRSVRFDKDNAYVCTAVQLSDPVFYFDLSDLNNITVKDTGTISGYSISLVNFGNYLLGIGYSDSLSSLKIELYEETPTGVKSVCTYEVPSCYFSSDYKSYLIDRENMYIGLGYCAYEPYYDCYTLLLFDGYDFVELIKAPITGENAYKRAIIIDNYIYMFGENFMVCEL